MDKDVSGLQTFISDWFPTKVKEVVTPIIDNAEQTLTEARQHVANTLRSNINKQLINLNSLHHQILNVLDDRLTPLEGRLDQNSRQVLQRIDAHLAPLVQTAALPNVGIPCGPESGTNIECVQPTFGPGETAIGPMPGDGGILSPGITPGGTLENCPIPEPCPEPKPCPPQACIQFDIYERPCKEDKDLSCLYCVPTGTPPLSKQDKLMVPAQTCTPDFLFVYQDLYGQDCPGLAVCPPQPKPGGGGNGIQPGGTLQNCPCVPATPGGKLDNQPIPTMPIVVVPNAPSQPIPVSPTPLPFPVTIVPGKLDNQQQPQAKCWPTGDIAYYLQECDDGTKIDKLWSQIADKKPSDVFGTDSAAKWYKDQIKEGNADTEYDIVGLTLGVNE